MSPRKPTDRPANPDPIEETEPPGIPQQHDAGAALQKDRAGPIREKYPVTEGAANFASMHARAVDAVAYAAASAPEGS